MNDERKDEQKSPPQEKPQEEQRDPEQLQDLDIRVEESKDITGGNTRTIAG
jgi:hypothetical protein